MAGMILNAFLNGTGKHLAGWRLPESRIQPSSIAQYRAQAVAAEQAGFHALFLADSLAVRSQLEGEALSRSSGAAFLEPLTLLSALSAVTSRIGLIATASTSYNHPYHVARAFASLDHLSGGRAGWNLVTSYADAEARNFGLPKHLDHGARYERAEEFFDVVDGLWNSWDADAFVEDKASGRFFQPDGLHVLNHHGAHFQVRGPLNVARSPQGRPLIVQAGASEQGMRLAARTADMVFVGHTGLVPAQDFYARLKALLPRFGRQPEHLKILPGITPIIGDTLAEAQALHARLQAQVHPVLGLQRLNASLGNVIDLSTYPLDGPLPPIPLANGVRSRQGKLIEMAEREGLTIGQLIARVAASEYALVGTASQVVDHMERWYREGAADGFNVSFPYLPGGFDAFVRDVVPELKRRGLLSERPGDTLRDRLGLALPATTART